MANPVYGTAGLSADRLSIIPVFNNILMAHSHRLRHEEQISSSWLHDGNRLEERWSFE
jgi:hypothetical protein